METFALTAKGAIVNRLLEAAGPLAVHEMYLPGFSENAIATRLSEMAKAGYVVGTVRPGKRFKEWALVKHGELPSFPRERSGR